MSKELVTLVVLNSLLNSSQNEEEIWAIGYIRQSDEREDKEDISEQTQLKKITQYCEFNGWKLAKVFKDIDYSGFRISYTKRPGIMEGLAYLNTDHRIKKFVVFNLSRLTRRRKDFLLLNDSLCSYGVDICSTAELLDFGSPTGRLVANILVNFNEYYSDNLSDVTMDNKKTNAQKGRWNGGPAPFGLKKAGDVFVEDEYSPFIRTAFVMAKEGKGPYRIAKWLKSKSVFTKTGVEWSPRRVRYMLSNPTYAAMQEWDGEYYLLIGFAKLVEWDDFLYIQRTLFGKEKAWKGKDRQMLSSILACPVCGSKMHSRHTNSKKTRRYVCSRKNEPGSCQSPVIDLPSLNDAVLDEIERIAKMRYTKNDILNELPSGESDAKSKAQELRDEYDNLEAAKQKVFDDYYLGQKLTEDQFTNLTKRYEKRQRELEILLEQTPIPRTNKYGDFDDLLNEMGEATRNANTDDLRILLELIVEKIVPDKVAKIIFKWGEIVELTTKRIEKNRSEILFYK